MTFHSNSGKFFRPNYPYGPRPIPSAQFSYEHNQCREWFDRWFSRGGNFARDAVYLMQAHDLPDIRSNEDKELWYRIERALYVQRSAMRRRELGSEMRIRRAKIIPITRKPNP